MKQDEFVKKIEAEFRSTLEKRYGEIEAKFTCESNDKKLNRPKIIGGEVVVDVQVDHESVEVKKRSEKKLSPSPTVEEIEHNEPHDDEESNLETEHVAEDESELFE